MQEDALFAVMKRGNDCSGLSADPNQSAARDETRFPDVDEHRVRRGRGRSSNGGRQSNRSARSDHAELHRVTTFDLEEESRSHRR